MSLTTPNVIFVSALYSIYKNTYADEVWKRMELLASCLPFHLFCNSHDAIRISKIPNITVHIKEFNELETYRILNTASELPSVRKPVKDTKEFMILMNAKTEFMKMLKESHPANHYVWIDAGISKIFKNPIQILSQMYRTLQYPIRATKIVIPGCRIWGPTTDPKFLTNSVSWRFCGGFFIVPNQHIDIFYRKVLEGCRELLEKTGIATWEVNVWVYKESQLPIQWEDGNHDEAMFDCVHRIVAS